MGWRDRRSVGLGPFGMNLCGSGIGYSVGVPGFRVAVRANGRRLDDHRLAFTVVAGRVPGAFEAGRTGPPGNPA